jgi:hypothetical protein
MVQTLQHGNRLLAHQPCKIENQLPLVGGQTGDLSVNKVSPPKAKATDRDSTFLMNVS